MLKWAGVVYLLCMGLLYLRRAMSVRQATPHMSATGTFCRGFYVSISNPKTLLFFVAFLPQFATAGEYYQKQIAILSLCFLCLAVLLDSLYAVLASTLYSLLQRYPVNRLQNGMTGVLLLGAGAWLAGIRRFS